LAVPSASKTTATWSSTNPELELVGDDNAADAVLMFRFDPQAGEHIIRLIDPVANR
jgi:hypothetical protein